MKSLSRPPENLERFEREPLAFDTETTGLNWPLDSMFAYSLALGHGIDVYVDVRHDEEGHAFWSDWLNNRHRGGVVCHNFSFDYRMATTQGIFLDREAGNDTVIMANILNEHEHEYGLDYLAKKYLGAEKVPIWDVLAEKFGGPATRKRQMQNLKLLNPEDAAPYAKEDANLTLMLFHKFYERIKNDGLARILMLELEAMPRFIEAEMAGIRVDLEYAIEAADRLTPIIEETQERLNFLIAPGFNANSSPQVRNFFQPDQREDGEWYVGNVRVGKTGKGLASLGAVHLRALADAGSLAAGAILELRSLIKTRDTFIRGHVLGHAVGDRVYPTINQTKSELAAGTGTGRLSYTNPAMQQIPSRNKRVAAITKPMFLPDVGQVWVDSDLASFEVRVFAHAVANDKIIEEYKKNPNLDFHQFVADLTGLVRDPEFPGQPNAKQLNLSMLFNQGDGATAEKMGMPWTWDSFLDRKGERVTYKKAGPEAKRAIATYHRRLPGAKELAERESQNALSHRYITTDMGRRCRFPYGHKAYKASGIKIQATAADLNKENWILAKVVQKFGGRLILNTHDSYSFSMDPDTVAEAFQAFKEKVEEPGRLKVPLRLEYTGQGRNWWEAISGDADELEKAKRAEAG